MSKRAFVFVALVASAAFAQAGQRPALHVIDAHTHPEFKTPADRDAFLRAWSAAGLAGAVGILHTQDGNVPDLGDKDIVYCAGVTGEVDLHGIETGLQSHRYGCIKIYLGYEPYWASDPRYEPVYALAERYDVPVVFHTGDTDNPDALVKYADPLTVDEVAVRHRKMRIVLAHCGNPWIESAAEVAYKNPNVWIDGSAMLNGDVSKLPPETVDTYMLRPLRWVFGYLENPQKLLFGSDWPVTDIAAYLHAFQRAIPQKYWRDVFHDNATRVFKFRSAQ